MSEEMVAGTLGFDESYDLGNTRRESAKKSIKAVGYNNDLDSFRMYTVYGNNPGRTVRGGSSYNRSSKASIPAADADRATKVKLELGNDPLVSADARYGYRFVKRAFDILFSAVVLIFFSWLYVLIAIAVKVDDPSGPVFFKQKRVEQVIIRHNFGSCLLNTIKAQLNNGFELVLNESKCAFGRKGRDSVSPAASMMVAA